MRNAKQKRQFSRTYKDNSLGLEVVFKKPSRKQANAFRHEWDEITSKSLAIIRDSGIDENSDNFTEQLDIILDSNFKDKRDALEQFITEFLWESFNTYILSWNIQDEDGEAIDVDSDDLDYESLLLDDELDFIFDCIKNLMGVDQKTQKN